MQSIRSRHSNFDAIGVVISIDICMHDNLIQFAWPHMLSETQVFIANIGHLPTLPNTAFVRGLAVYSWPSTINALRSF